MRVGRAVGAWAETDSEVLAREPWREVAFKVSARCPLIKGPSTCFKKETKYLETCYEEKIYSFPSYHVL